MSRLVTVSNRVALPSQLQAAQGGLAVGLRSALEESGGMWFGWDGGVDERIDGLRQPRVQTANGVRYATLRLSRLEYDRYYLGYANQVLWPLFHYRMSFVHCRRERIEGYWEVNRLFAEHLPPLLEGDEIIWVHDYHFIPLGQLLREQGVEAPIGFFLHTPFPPWDVFRALPGHEPLLEALCRYDLVGFQTRIDRDNFLDCLTHYRPQLQRPRAEVFPISIDVDQVAREAQRGYNSQQGRRLQQSLRDRRLMIGVDRLDYSKGLRNRFEAYEALLEQHSEHRGDVVFLQIAPVSRGDVPEYEEIRQYLEYLAGHINGRFAEYDWVPLRYLNRGFHRSNILGFLARSDVGLITPMRDGMNLVAKEFVAAQDPGDPGALVLSRYAGAAEELDGAVLVNPYDVDQMVDAMHQALTMPLGERRERWQQMMDALRRQDVHRWRKDFIQALHDAHRARGSEAL
ncbi:alpha,alpha-trehalose-phosphate synthase (UDP-forming) [Halorhodospira halophila]|uniref:Trehalose-6-phosphate synthase n=1 Tax=Halorhodospira halophila (strain DSM 244 / SL1) TaxID=349124 RepID=A1WW34_HALHL|nr:trehalose-6-phosphate synthase [Halorhodospira halophila]ABM61896.1 trehalose 6-phosphate synthase [Halorhodospira halophila SL1]MBK1729882.1 trehalose-6-phosphate synthase [Halorhodospira halophila]